MKTARKPGRPLVPVITEAALRDCAARGLTQAEAAADLGVSRSTVHHAAKRHGVALRIGTPGRVPGAEPRVRLIIEALRSGLRQRDIAAALGITRGAVYQIARRHGGASE